MNPKQHINYLITEISKTGRAEIYFTGQIFALDYVVVKVHTLSSSHGGR